METSHHQEVTHPPSHQVKTISWQYHKLMTCDVEGTPNNMCNSYSGGVLAGSLIAEFVILVVVTVIIVVVVEYYRWKQRCGLYLESVCANTFSDTDQSQ